MLRYQGYKKRWNAHISCWIGHGLYNGRWNTEIAAKGIRCRSLSSEDEELNIWKVSLSSFVFTNNIHNLYLRLRTLQDSNEGKRTEQQDTKNTQIFCNKLWSEELFLRPVVELESAAIKSDDCTKVFIIAGIYNSLDIFTQLASQIKGRTIYLQYSGSSFGKTVPEMGRRIYKVIVCQHLVHWSDALNRFF